MLTGKKKPMHSAPTSSRSKGSSVKRNRRRILVAAIAAVSICSVSVPWSGNAIAGDAAWAQNCPPVVVETPCPPAHHSGGHGHSHSNPHVWDGTPQYSQPMHQHGAPQHHSHGATAPGQFEPPVLSPGSGADPFTDDGLGQPSTLPQSEQAPPSQSQSEPSTEPQANTPDPFDGVNATDNSPNSNFDNISSSDLSSSSAASQSSFTSAPTIIGDFQGGGLAQFNATVTRDFSFFAQGTQGALPTFDRVPGGGFNPDILSLSGTGQSVGGSAFTNQFGIAEPVPPTDANLAPGPNFQFQGGTATFTGSGGSTIPSTADYTNAVNGDEWFVQYQYAAQIGGFGIGGGLSGPRPAPSPGVSVRRVKISENFSPEIRNRFFTNFSFFNDTFGGLGDISRYVIGLEQVLVDDLISVELRLPVAATYGSDQDLGLPEDRDIEIGNFTLISKFALWRTESLLVSAGLGIGTPTAQDTRLSIGGVDLLEVRNETVQIQPFMGALYRWNDDWSFQAYMQLDVAAGGDAVMVNGDFDDPTANRLEFAGDFKDSTLMHLDFSASKSLYRTSDREARLTNVLANAEVHYTSTLEDSSVVQSNNFTYTNLKNRFDIVNMTFGSHFVFKNGLVATPAIAVPLTEGLDKQFDFEAIVQLNYVR